MISGGSGNVYDRYFQFDKGISNTSLGILDFSREVLGLTKLSNNLHKEVLDFILSNRKCMVLLPRGHFKSSLITQAYVIWRILINPNIRILIASSGVNKARRFLNYHRREFTYNRSMKSLFPEFCFDNEVSNRTQFQVPPKLITEPQKEMTIEIASVDMGVASAHYDLIIYDDLLDEDNTRTLGSMIIANQWFKQSIPLLDDFYASNDMMSRFKKLKSGEIIVIGTRWHDTDLYGEIIDNKFMPYMVKAVEEKGVPILPEIFDNNKILERRKMMMNDDMFFCQYYNNPTNKENVPFQKSWIRYYDDNEFAEKKKNMVFYTGIDLAISESEKADFTSIITVGVDDKNSWYIADLDVGHWDTRDICEHIIWNYEKYNPIDVALETQGFQKAILYTLQDMTSERCMKPLPITEIKQTAERPKEYRIKQLVGMFKNGKIHLPNIAKYQANYPQWDEFMNEYTRFPKGRHDDVLDSLAMILDLDPYNIKTSGVDNRNYNKSNIFKPLSYKK